MKNKLTLKDIEGMEQGLEDLTDLNQRRALCEKINTAAKSLISEIWSIDECNVDVGLGWMEGRLISFRCEVNSGFVYKELTVAQSVEWMEKMHFIESELRLSSQSDPNAYVKWLSVIRGALTANAVALRN